MPPTVPPTMSPSGNAPGPLSAGFAGLAFGHCYTALPEQFYTRTRPTPVAAPALIKVNHTLALELNLDPAALESAQGVALLAGNVIPADARPLAQVYAGHQFGYFNPQLGDGRAILLGEVRDRAGNLRDIQWKGSGPTPYSRSGDGRAAIGPVVREYLVSEAMHALGIRTTRSLAAVTTGDRVFRESPLPGAILTRVAASHVRIGTFEYFRGKGDQQSIKKLADFVIARHYPRVAQADRPYVALLEAVIQAQAELVASWMHVGFIHGVMNTDNMTISGETIDYGPCAFMNGYDSATVYSSIDARGRYAFGNQPSIALWNLTRFAECLLELLDADAAKAQATAEASLSNFSDHFAQAWYGGMWRKIGLEKSQEGDENLLGELLTLMQENDADYTLVFRRLADYLAESAQPEGQVAAKHELESLFSRAPDEFAHWRDRWETRLGELQESLADVGHRLRKINPLYIPRNHHVEDVIRAAEQGEYRPMNEMLAVLQEPFTEQPGAEAYAQPPAPGEDIEATFCGT